MSITKSLPDHATPAPRPGAASDDQREPTLPTAFPAVIGADLLAGQVGASTIAQYRTVATLYATWCTQTQCDPLAAPSLARWRVHLTTTLAQSPHTINRKLAAVKSIVRGAADQGYVAVETAEAFARVRGVTTKALKTRQRTQPSPEQLTRAQVTRLYRAAYGDGTTLRQLRDGALILTLATSGCRVSEVATLCWSQISQVGAHYVMWIAGKNDVQARQVPLAPKAYAAIAQWRMRRGLDDVDAIFTGFRPQNGEPVAKALTTVRIWQLVKEYAHAVGVDQWAPHWFRKFVGTQLAKKDLRQAQLVLGHRDPGTTTRHYVFDALETGLTDDFI